MRGLRWGRRYSARCPPLLADVYSPFYGVSVAADWRDHFFASGLSPNRAVESSFLSRPFPVLASPPFLLTDWIFHSATSFLKLKQQISLSAAADLNCEGTSLWGTSPPLSKKRFNCGLSCLCLISRFEGSLISPLMFSEKLGGRFLWPQQTIMGYIRPPSLFSSAFLLLF